MNTGYGRAFPALVNRAELHRLGPSGFDPGRMEPAWAEDHLAGRVNSSIFLLFDNGIITGIERDEFLKRLMGAIEQQ